MKNNENNNKYIELISGVTRESGKIIGNALASIKSRIETVDKVKEYLKSKNIDIENKDFDNVMKAISQKWNDFSDSEKTDISIYIAGRYQMSRFAILMNKLSEDK